MANEILIPAFANSSCKTAARSDSLFLSRCIPLSFEGFLPKQANAASVGKRSGELVRSRLKDLGFFFEILI